MTTLPEKQPQPSDLSPSTVLDTLNGSDSGDKASDHDDTDSL